MSRTRDSNGNGHSHESPQPPDHEAHPFIVDDDPETMPMDELAFQAAHRAWRLQTLVHTLTLHWSDDGDIKQLFEALHDLISPLCEQLGTLQDRLGRPVEGES